MGQSRSLLRLLAPTALLVFGLALVAIVASTGPLAGPTASTEPSATAQRGAQTTSNASPSGDSSRRSGRRRRSYTVRAGDTLGAIAEDTGVSVDELQRLNPDLDPQALGAGEKLKLR